MGENKYSKLSIYQAKNINDSQIDFSDFSNLIEESDNSRTDAVIEEVYLQANETYLLKTELNRDNTPGRYGKVNLEISFIPVRLNIGETVLNFVNSNCEYFRLNFNNSSFYTISCSENGAVFHLFDDELNEIKTGDQNIRVENGGGKTVYLSVSFPATINKEIIILCTKEKDIEFITYGKKNKKLSKEAERISGQAEVTLFFAGLDEYSEAEGIDRKDMKIPENQIEVFKDLIKAGRKVVLILHCGSSVELDWTEGASAILYMGLSGQAGASACINLLTGKANPCGKLAETWWRKYEDCPTSDSELFPGGEDEVVYREGLFSGYRAKTKTPPRYEFGYGLSYTKFEYENLRITENEISFDIKNAGSLAGKEIAQLYFGKKESRIKRPKRQLFAFINVYLEKGEKKEVTIPYDRKEFSYYDESENKWEVERGEYIIEVGASSEDIRLSGQFFVEGKELSNDCIKEYFPAVRKTEKRKGMTIGENSTVSDLRYAKGWVGRVFAWGIRSAIKVCNAFGKKSTANTLIMGVMYQPVRGLAKFGGMDRRKMEGLLWMFNGSFFKGFGMFLTKGKQKKEIKA